MASEREVALAPELELVLARDADIPPLYEPSKITRKTVWVAMRDGVRLATDLYLPPDCPAPAIARRTPYGRAVRAEILLALARHGYVVIAQDCRGTGDSEPDQWEFMIYEREDSLDFVDWVAHQEWFDGFLGACGGSYVGWLQWCMATHGAMSAIAPEVSGFGVGRPRTAPSIYMFANAYSRSVGKGVESTAVGYDEMERQMLAETLAGGYFNEPLHAPLSDALIERFPDLQVLPPTEGPRWLYQQYRRLPPAERAELIKLALGEDRVTYEGMLRFGASVFRPFGDGHVFPRSEDAELFQSLHAPALVITGWYDWGLDYTLATWELLTAQATEPVRSRSRLFIAPSAHNMPGYREGRDGHPELDRTYRANELETLQLLVHWYRAVRDDALGSWPTVVYYLMGANKWHAASAWPPPEAKTRQLYLAPNGQLATQAPAETAEPDGYTYDPEDPTPTVGGSVVSYVYTPGSVDVSEVQERRDVLTYTSDVLERDLDVVGPLRLIVYASSSALDTDFSARVSDVFPDGRAIQLQSGMLRARFRNGDGRAELLEPGRIYRLEIEIGATANRFAAGHRLRLDISSADFPKFDRNTNRGGEAGPPIPATQTICHDSEHPSHLVLSTIERDY